MLFDALKQVGVRAIISSGWAGLGKGREHESEDIYILTGKISESLAYLRSELIIFRGLSS